MERKRKPAVVRGGKKRGIGGDSYFFICFLPYLLEGRGKTRGSSLRNPPGLREKKGKKKKGCSSFYSSSSDTRKREGGDKSPGRGRGKGRTPAYIL